MTQTGTIFDGDTAPFIAVIGPRGTGGCFFNAKAENPEFKRLELGDGVKDPEAYISELPEEKRPIARAALR